MSKLMEKEQRGAKAQNISQAQIVKQYFFAHLAAFKRGLRNLSLSPLAALMTIFSIGLCLALPGGLYLFIKNIQALSQGWDQGAVISLYVDPHASPKQTEFIINQIKTYPFVNEITAISPQEALKEFQETSGLKEVLALLPENPLPGVISIQLNTKAATRAELMAMKVSLTKLPRVQEAMFDYEWVEKLDLFLSFGKTLAWCLYLLISFGVILIVSNTIRLMLERHRDETEVLNLIGATVAFIRRPFLYRGILYGALGGMVAIFILNIITHTLGGKVADLTSLYQSVFVLENLTFSDSVLLLGGSAALGWIGALFAFNLQYHSLSSA